MHAPDHRRRPGDPGQKHRRDLQTLVHPAPLGRQVRVYETHAIRAICLGSKKRLRRALLPHRFVPLFLVVVDRRLAITDFTDFAATRPT
eukprot:9472734-Pyramimonas_sp.AAC.1